MCVCALSLRPGLGSVWGVCYASAGTRLWLGGAGDLCCCPAPGSSHRTGAGPHPHSWVRSDWFLKWFYELKCTLRHLLILILRVCNRLFSMEQTFSLTRCPVTFLSCVAVFCPWCRDQRPSSWRAVVVHQPSRPAECRRWSVPYFTHNPSQQKWAGQFSRTTAR